MNKKAKVLINNLVSTLVINYATGKKSNAFATTSIITTAIAIGLSFLDPSNPFCQTIIENKGAISSIVLGGAGALYGLGKK